jgi:CMP-N-acetylneuraminic acid synthetase
MFEVICVIPARGESKRFPGKNIALLNGKPLIQYSIEAWEKSRYYSKPIVSTDSPGIAEVAARAGATVIIRPANLSHGDINPALLLSHIADHIEKYYQKRVQWILLLQPTSPLRSTEDIDVCLDIVARNEADSVTSINPNSKYDSKENGAIYITHADLVKQGSIYGPGLYRYLMPDDRSIDIDYPEDLEKAEEILKGGRNDNSRGLHQLPLHSRSKKDHKNSKRNKPGRAG